ncbi:aspartic proteinase CDR1-like [Solanum dulcamara]|uniref:aspartic proteinase CDR1-like n=1 Tax=Solanum dulcamara TaxID=45834 RepID=UPI0024852C55|nr:aspartic proteinase CDR1-like [Solanum dulcamara]
MTIFSFTLLIAFSLAITLTQTSLLRPEAEAKSGGFSIELIHPASKRSPASLSTELVPDLLGVYLINFSVGTPPKFQLAGADSGSDINWIQCEPCVQCYSQHLPIFNSLNSSTYKALPCNSSKCLGECHGSQCTYGTNYTDQSYSYGDLATEIFTFYSPQGFQEISFPDILFGCAHRSKLQNTDQMTTGIMGLGISPMSLVSQISPAFGKKFFYCFVPLAQLDVPSTLTFGENAWGSTGSVLFTPIHSNPSNSFYLLTLLGISVGDKRFDFFGNSSTISPEGNIAIDSGTTLTVLPTLLYNQVKTTISQAINVEPLVNENSTNICYKDLNAFDVPPVTMHFIAADVPLSKDNIIWPAGQGIWCLAFRPTENQPFYGNVAQTNFLVGYDLNKMIVSFKATDCTKMA